MNTPPPATGGPTGLPNAPGDGLTSVIDGPLRTMALGQVLALGWDLHTLGLYREFSAGLSRLVDDLKTQR